MIYTVQELRAIRTVGPLSIVYYVRTDRFVFGGYREILPGVIFELESKGELERLPVPSGSRTVRFRFIR